VLVGWRGTTIDVDLKMSPEPEGAFEAIAALKDELDINVELAAPDLADAREMIACGWVALDDP
jgi:hypothetical protein